MNKIKYCTDDFLEEYRTNFDRYFELYEKKDKEGLDAIFNNPENIKESDLEFEYKPLVLASESENPERDNIKIVFNSLKDLEIKHAMQEKLWVAMYNTYYQDHIFDYIDQTKHYKLFYSKLRGSLIFYRGRKRSQIIHNLSRFWWLGYYLYDEENKENPYWLLDFYTSTGDIIGRSTMFFSSSLTNNKDLRLGIVEGIKELTEAREIVFDRYHYINTNRYLNLIGSVKILDLMSREEAKKLTKEYIRNNINEDGRAIWQ